MEANGKMDAHQMRTIREVEDKLTTAAGFLFRSRGLGVAGSVTLNLTIGAIQGAIEDLERLVDEVEGGAA